MNTLKTEYRTDEVSFVRSQVRRRRLLSAVPALTRFAAKVGGRLQYYGRELTAYERDQYESGSQNRRPENLETVGYQGDKEVQTFLSYRNQLSDEQRLHNSESEVLYQQKEQWLETLFRDTDPDIDALVNFGVCYAYVDYLLAKKFPGVKFIGIDREPITKALNEVEFKDCPNMDFVAADIWDYLPGGSFNNGVFLHARTMLLFNRPLVEDIYGLVAKCGFKYIVGFEQFGISRTTGQGYTFDENDKESAYFRDGMYTHNYPWLLKKAGYEIQRAEIIKTGHPFPDYRFLAFIAKLSQ